MILPLSVFQKIAIAEKSLRFQIATCKIAGFTAEKWQKNRQKIAAKIAGKSLRFLLARNKNRSVSAFSNRSVFGTLSPAQKIVLHGFRGFAKVKNLLMPLFLMGCFSVLHLWGRSGRGHCRKFSANFCEISANFPQNFRTLPGAIKRSFRELSAEFPQKPLR